MIDLATWRARIGLYNVATGGPSGRRAKVLRRPPAGDWSLLLALCTSAVEVVTLHLVIFSLLLLAGDVEQNPGPGTVADDNNAVYQVFRSHFDQLVSGITQPVTLAGVLYSRELINRAMNNEIITLPTSDADKAARLMNAVEATMKADPKPARVLRELCDAMEFDDPALKHVADSIRAALDQPAPSPSTSPAPTPHTPGLQKFIDHLKYYYIKKSPLLKESTLHVRPRKYIHLNLVSSEEEEEEEIKKECLLLQLHGDVVGIKKKRKAMEMENIGRSEDQLIPQHILVEGAPGIGKTMFAWEVCRQWAEGKMLQDWEIVQMLQLRSKGVREAKTLSDLFQHNNSGIKQEVLEHITTTDGKGVFLILEGYDELADSQKTEGSIFHSLLVGKVLPRATIMVTSRPLASHSLCPEFRESLDQHIEIVGFTDDDIQSYVETTCKKQPGILLADLKSFVSSNPFVSSVMYIPLQCAILTALYIQNWKRKGKSYAPSTLTQLYTDLLLSLLRRYVDDHPDYKKQKLSIRQLSDFPREVQEQVWKLSKLAAEGLENRQYVFDSVPCDHMGLMQGAEEELMLGSEVSYCFLHLTLQEYLAALYWSKLDSEGMARVVSESGLFPLTTLVSEGITKKSGYHWPALFFLAGLTELMSVPLHLLKSSLIAGEELGFDDFNDDPVFTVHLALMEGSRDCNPYFFQLLFEAHSSDLVTKVFAKQNVGSRISTPLEGFVTAWCIANSDSTSTWLIGINSTSALGQLQPQLKRLDCHSTGHRHGRIVGFRQLEGDVSETLGEILKLHPCTQDLNYLHLNGEFTIEIKDFPPLPSLFPSLETADIVTKAGDSTWLIPALSGIHEMSSLKTFGFLNEGENGLIFTPSKQYPSLFVIGIKGSEFSFLFPSFVLPKFYSLAAVELEDCPLTSADLSALCSRLCQTNTLKTFKLTNTKLETQGAKQLAAALQQNWSLKKVKVNDETIGVEGIRVLETVLQNHVTVEKYDVTNRH